MKLLAIEIQFSKLSNIGQKHPIITFKWTKICEISYN